MVSPEIESDSRIEIRAGAVRVAHALSTVARSSDMHAVLDRGSASLDLQQANPAAHGAPRIHETLPQG